jgi:hypothetical protein
LLVTPTTASAAAARLVLMTGGAPGPALTYGIGHLFGTAVG